MAKNSHLNTKNADLSENQAFDAQHPADDILDQLKLAGRIQRDFLPSRLPDTDKLKWASVYRPADWVSGDMYDIKRLDEEHIGFYLADAVGHSVPAALLTMFLKQAIVMRETVGNEYTIFQPKTVLEKLNSRLISQKLTGSLFITCFYGLLNINTLELTYARAGYPYPILKSPGKAPTNLESTGSLLGVFDSAVFEQQKVQLTAGDRLFVFSDGSEPAIGKSNQQGQLEYFDEFADILDMPADKLIAEFDLLTRKAEIAKAEIDDITAIALEVR